MWVSLNWTGSGEIVSACAVGRKKMRLIAKHNRYFIRWLAMNMTGDFLNCTELMLHRQDRFWPMTDIRNGSVYDAVAEKTRTGFVWHANS
jgi:hypothetical protein